MTCMRQTKSADFALSTRAVPAALTLENAAVGWAGRGIDVGPDIAWHWLLICA